MLRHRPPFEEIAGFHDRWIITFGWPLASVLVTLLLFPEAVRQGDFSALSTCGPMAFVYTAAFWAGMRFIYTELKWHYPRFDQMTIRMVWVFVGYNAIFALVNTVLDWCFVQVGILHSTAPNLIVEYVSSLILCALVITMYEAISFYIQLQKTAAEKVLLERQNVESQLEGLRNQVNPHFLFNSLNTLIYLIPEDADKAVNFVQKLSKVYRYVLESREAKVIPLAEEMEFLKSYLFLLKERFGENLVVNIRDVDQYAQAAIVPLSLQMLFENAIKHNVISTQKPLSIEVFVEKNHLVVRNQFQRKNQVMDSTGVGLQNIRDRYRILTARPVEVIASPQYFTVALPLLSLQPATAADREQSGLPLFTPSASSV